MKKLLLILFALIVIGCEKEKAEPAKDDSCKTCTEKIVKSWYAADNQTVYLTPIERCNWDWTTYHGDTWISNQTGSSVWNHSITCQ